MSNYYQSKAVAARKPLTESSRAGEVNIAVGEYLVQAAAFIVGDIIEFPGVPANHVVDSVTVLSDQIDSNGTPTLAFDVGFLTGNPGDLAGLVAGTRTMGAEFFSAATAPVRAGGSVASTLVAMARQVASTADRNLGVKITAIAATQVAAARLRVRVGYIADPGMLT
jgi:hypothetical protein